MKDGLIVLGFFYGVTLLVGTLWVINPGLVIVAVYACPMIAGIWGHYKQRD